MTSSENNVITGLQWGNEGKKKLTDFFANRSEVIVRFNGSSTGGHSINAGGEEFILNYLPCGIHHDGKLCVITHGVTLDLEATAREIELLKNAGVMKARLRISSRCPLILSYHKKLDIFEGRIIGHDLNRTLEQRGYGPALADAVRRLGLIASDLLNPPLLRKKIEQNLEIKNEYFTKLYGEKPLSAEAVYDEANRTGGWLRPYIAPVGDIVREAVQRDRGTLFEGCDGSLDDLNCGMYPYIMPGSTIAPSVFLSTGIRHNSSLRIIGAAKAYCTKNFKAPFITEEKNSVAAFIRSRGSEFDELTQAPRRIGWLDLPALRYAARVNCVDVLALTKLDVLTGIDVIKVCTAYRIDGKEVRDGDITAEEALRAQPIYTLLEGWREELPGHTKFSSLPPQTQNYISFIEENTGLRVIWAGLGRQWGNALFDPAVN